MRNKKTSFMAFILAALILPVFIPAAARASVTGFVYDNPQTGYSVYIDDEQDLLTDAEELSLIEDMKPITEYGNAGFVSCENYSYSTSSYSEMIYQNVFGSQSGTMLVIDMGAREFYIKNNGEISETITNAYSNTISDNIYKYAAAGDYYGCASNYCSQVLTLLEGGRVAQPMRYITAALLAVILGLLVNFMFLLAVTLPHKADKNEIIDAARVDFLMRNPNAVKDHTTKVYSPVRTSGRGGGGSRGGGGFSGGGGSGGGHRF